MMNRFRLIMAAEQEIGRRVTRLHTRLRIERHAHPFMANGTVIGAR